MVGLSNLANAGFFHFLNSCYESTVLIKQLIGFPKIQHLTKMSMSVCIVLFNTCAYAR